MEFSWTTYVLSHRGGNNRMDGYSYDAAGNVLNDNAGHGFTYMCDGTLSDGRPAEFRADADGNAFYEPIVTYSSAEDAGTAGALSAMALSD